MKRPPLLSRLWLSEKGLSGMLVFLCLAIFVGTPLVETGTTGMFLFDVVFSLVLVSGVVTVARQPLITAVVSALAVITLALRWTSFESPQSATRLWGHTFTIISFAIMAALVLRQVLAEGPITPYRIQGAVVVYLLLGLVWNAAYQLVYSVLPEAFQFAERGSAQMRTHGLVYFSFVTLTTTGYGDIVPVHPVARSLATAEALTGQLYLAILITRLVSLRVSEHRAR